MTTHSVPATISPLLLIPYSSASTMDISPLFNLLAILILVYVLMKLKNIGKREDGLPPGPPTIPLLGYAHLMPHKNVHEKYATLLFNAFQAHFVGNKIHRMGSPVQWDFLGEPLFYRDELFTRLNMQDS